MKGQESSTFLVVLVIFIFCTGLFVGGALSNSEPGKMANPRASLKYEIAETTTTSIPCWATNSAAIELEKSLKVLEVKKRKARKMTQEFMQTEDVVYFYHLGDNNDNEDFYYVQSRLYDNGFVDSMCNFLGSQTSYGSPADLANYYNRNVVQPLSTKIDNALKNNSTEYIVIEVPVLNGKPVKVTTQGIYHWNLTLQAEKERVRRYLEINATFYPLAQDLIEFNRVSKELGKYCAK